MQTYGPVLAATILGIAIVGAAAILRFQEKPSRYTMMRSGFNNTVWVLDQTTGETTYCGSFKTGLKCRKLNTKPVEPVLDDSFELETPSAK